MALMALCSVATAASIGVDEMDSSQKAGVVKSWNDALTINSSSDCWANVNTGESFTFSFDVSNITNVAAGRTIFSVAGSHNESGYNDGKLQVVMNESGSLTLLNTPGGNNATHYFDGSTPSSPAVSAYSSALGLTATDSLTSVTTFTFVSDDTAKTFTIYRNGEQIDQWTGWDTDTGIIGVQVGGRWGAGNKIQGSESVVFDNVTIWNRALSASEVSGLVVPEPTTATLSLLALAGLAARRRRK